MKKKILFLIHDLGHGGAEKVLVNLVNNMDPEQFDITVMALFGGGVNERFLKPHIRLVNCHARSVPGNSKLMKLLTPAQLHCMYIKEHYDVEVAYLEGPAVRVISGCPDSDTKLISWVHCTMRQEQEFSGSFRSCKEAVDSYSRFHKSVFVSREVMDAFQRFCPVKDGVVLYNTNDSGRILAMAEEPVSEVRFQRDKINLVGVGKIEEVKGFDRLARVHERLVQEGYPVHTYILGTGSKQAQIESFLRERGVSDSFTFLGYQTNPYKFIRNCDLFVCSSYSEGFSTAATEALIVGTPVVTTRVSGMEELLGGNNEWGIITENNEEALFEGLKQLLDAPKPLDGYLERVAQRGNMFSTENTVVAVERMLNTLL